MSNLDTFLAEGAYTCAGSLVHRGIEVGAIRDGDLALNEAGRAALVKLDEVTDVVVKAPKGKKAAAVVEPDAEAQLDALLAG